MSTTLTADTDKRTRDVEAETSFDTPFKLGPRSCCDCMAEDNEPALGRTAESERVGYESAYLSGCPSTVRFLLSRGVPFDFAEELAQAAWAKGWERLNQLRDPRLLNSWVNSIALNMHRGTCRRHALLALEDASECPDWDRELDLQRALNCLRSGDRRRIEKRYFEGLGIREIAQSEGTTEGAVRIRLLRSRRLVGRALLS